MAKKKQSSGQTPKIEAPGAVHRLVERFCEQADSYRAGRYNETQLRREFIDPLFTALGWDVANEQDYAEAYKDVIHEDAIKVGGVTKAPDYCFRIGGVRKFFVEAKKPSIDIKGDPGPAFQLRRYAWSAKLPLSILTDFEELAVYDCRVRPVKTDKPSKARVMYLRYEQYPEQWGDLAGVFAREAILKGSFDRYAESGKRKKGTAEVDDAFLAEIEQWRDALARNIALRNPSLTQRELNFAVQRTIDRIVFLRICEDRGIEQYGALQGLLNGSNVYERLFALFRAADARYNSGLFHFEPERDRTEPPDDLTPALTIDDKPLKDILAHMYYPESPYEFSVLPADILGQVYEQFLGKVIRLTRGHQARVEEKPEVRKAGGVYYTPTHIVDYIVKHTVGKLVEDKTPREVGALTDTYRPSKAKGVRPLCVLDPACGSGSFLLGAYQYLLDWYRDQYVADGAAEHAKGREPRLFEHASGEWRLTIAERKRILLSHIYGVDIDTQAVEVTKLSLLLKVLEGESDETIGQNLRLFHERALPDLSNNIKCGNSLIGPDFYDHQQSSMFDEEQRLRINVFDWNAEFKDIMNAGGFDAVIGNPPWLMAGYVVKNTIDHLRQRYQSATGKFDLYYTFLEKGLSLSASDGRVGMIVPNKFFHTKAATALRSLVLETEKLKQVVDFKAAQVFRGATNYSCIVVFGPTDSSELSYVTAGDGFSVKTVASINRTRLSSDPWDFVDDKLHELFEKLKLQSDELTSITARFGTGVQTGADKVLTLAKSDAIKFEGELIRPVIRGRDVRRYLRPGHLKRLICPYQIRNDEFSILSEHELMEYEATYEYLLQHKEKLSSRVWFGKCAKELSGHWYGLMYLDNHKWFRRPHLLSPSLSNRSNFTLGTGDVFATGTAGVTSVVPKDDYDCDLLFLLGILNSSLLSLYAISHSPVFSGNYYKFSAPYLRSIPIRRIDFQREQDRKGHDSIVTQVQTMLDLYQQLAEAKTGHAATAIRRQIEATDRRIDQLVYELYGLTAEEIAIVEEATL